MKQYLLLAIVLLVLIVSCKRIEDPGYKDSVYLMKTFEFNREPDSIKNYLLRKIRVKYDLINDSTIAIVSITDSIQPWDSNHFVSDRDTMDLTLRLFDTLYSTFKEKYFIGFNINKNTRILLMNPVEGNDTLKYEGQKRYGNINVYSFYYTFHGFDGDYRLYLCDSIGELAFYSGAWNNAAILEKILYADDLNFKLKKIKNQLLSDTLFFPIPFEFLPKRE